MITAPAALDVSVIVPLYNAQRYLERCLDALCLQTLDERRFEILLVDNNSTDRSVEIARRYPRVTLLTEPRQGAYAARNRALEIARGRVLAFTDPDCVPTASWLAQMIDALGGGVRIVLGRTDSAHPSWPVRLMEEYSHQKLVMTFRSSDPLIYMGRTNNMAVTRDVFAVVGPFKERLRGADTMLARAAADAFGCDALIYAPHIRVAHLELTGMVSLLRKSFVYGRSTRSFGADVPWRQLPVDERRRAFREAVRSERHAGPAALMLSVAAVLMALAYRAGAFFARLSPTPRSIGTPGAAAERGATSGRPA